MVNEIELKHCCCHVVIVVVVVVVMLLGLSCLVTYISNVNEMNIKYKRTSSKRNSMDEFKFYVHSTVEPLY